MKEWTLTDILSRLSQSGILPDALRTECRKCSEQQRRGSERVLRYIIDNKKPEWAQLQRKYDPDNLYVQQAGRLGVRTH